MVADCVPSSVFQRGEPKLQQCSAIVIRTETRVCKMLQTRLHGACLCQVSSLTLIIQRKVKPLFRIGLNNMQKASCMPSVSELMKKESRVSVWRPEHHVLREVNEGVAGCFSPSFFASTASSSVRLLLPVNFHPAPHNQHHHTGHGKGVNARASCSTKLANHV